MNALPITIFILVCVAEFVVREGYAGSYFTLLPDALSAIALLIVAARFLATRTLYLDGRYLALLAALLVAMVLGVLWQMPSSGTIVSGLRQYFKYLPLFLLPAVYEFSPRQLKAQLIVFGSLLAVQPPLAAYQRFVQYASNMHDGDLIKGTLMSSGSLSILMICAMAFMVCAYLRGYIGMTRMLIATVYLSVPTMLNETKIAIALIPLAVITTVLSMPDRARVWRKLTPILAAGAVTIVSFVAVYDFIAQYNRYNTPIAEFLSERSLSSYLYTGRTSVVEEGYVGRADAMMIAVQRLSRDPTDLAFGLGIGNVSRSPVESFSGEFLRYDALYGASMTQISHLLWEVGVVGTLIYLLFFFVLWRDATWLTKQKDFPGLFGHVWTATIVMLVPGLFYLPLFVVDEIAAPLWFYAGYAAAARARASVIRKRDERHATQRVSLSGVN
jgi:hypothetical protein